MPHFPVILFSFSRKQHASQSKSTNNRIHAMKKTPLKEFTRKINCMKKDGMKRHKECPTWK